MKIDRTDFISAETLTALIAHMNTTVTEADFVGEDEEESAVATGTSLPARNA